MARSRETAALTLAAEPAPEPEAANEQPAAAEFAGDEHVIETKTDVRALALKHGPEAIAALVKIINDGASEASRIAAANALLDRAYGKARQGAAPVEPPEETRLTVMFV